MRFLSCNPRVLATGLAMLALVGAGLAQAADGVIATRSPHDARQTMDRFERLVTDKGMKVFARIDHAAGAASIGQSLRPTELLVFGNPKGGTPLMTCSQSFAIDLPLKALVWQDEAGTVWLGVNDMATLAQRHGAGDCPAVGKVQQAVDGFVKAAVAD